MQKTIYISNNATGQFCDGFLSASEWIIVPPIQQNDAHITITREFDEIICKVKKYPQRRLRIMNIK